MTPPPANKGGQFSFPIRLPVHILAEGLTPLFSVSVRVGHVSTRGDSTVVLLLLLLLPLPLESGSWAAAVGRRLLSRRP
jgi:hypothetical protein